MRRDRYKAQLPGVQQRPIYGQDIVQPHKRSRYAEESAASSARSSPPPRQWGDHSRPTKYSEYSGRSDPSWQAVGLPKFKNDRGKLVSMEVPSYLTMDDGELGAQRASTQNLINGKSHRDTSTLKMMQTLMTRICAVRTNTEVSFMDY